MTVRGFDASRSTYTRTYGSQDVDAALLILPLLGIEPPSSPRVRGTIRGHPRRTRRGRAAPLPLPARYRRPARPRGRLPAVLVLARPGTRQHRPGPRSSRAVRAAAGAGQPGRPLRRGDGPCRPTRTSATTRRHLPTRRSSRPRSRSGMSCRSADEDRTAARAVDVLVDLERDDVRRWRAALRHAGLAVLQLAGGSTRLTLPRGWHQRETVGGGASPQVVLFRWCCLVAVTRYRGWPITLEGCWPWRALLIARSCW